MHLCALSSNLKPYIVYLHSKKSKPKLCMAWCVTNAPHTRNVTQNRHTLEEQCLLCYWTIAASRSALVAAVAVRTWAPSCARYYLATQNGECLKLTTHTQVLQVSFEAPPGVKRNLQRTYDAWGSSLFSQASHLQAQLLFMLAWFHAIVQERRAYMPQASFAAPVTSVLLVQPCLHSCTRAKLLYSSVYSSCSGNSKLLR